MTMKSLENAISLHQQGLLAAACEAYLALLKRAPKDINVLNFLGVLYFQEGKVQEGAKCLRKCLQIKPDFAQAHNNLGNGLMQAGNLKEAIQCFSRAVALAPAYVEAHHNLANAYGKQKNFEKALQSAAKAVACGPGFPPAWASLAAAHYGLRHHREALAACERALQLSPDLADAALVKARVLWIQGQYLDAIAAYRQAIDKCMDDSDVLLEFGVHLLEVGRPDEALRHLEHLVQWQPECVSGLLWLGVAYEGLLRGDEAESCFRKAIALAPENGDAHFSLSKILRSQKKYEEAEVCAKRAVALNPKSPLFSSHLATLLSDVGRLDEACARLQDLLNKDPDDAEVLSLLVFLCNYSGSHSSEYRYQMALEYGRVIGKKVDARIEQWSVEENPVRLKVGLVSGDLQTHPVGLFLESVIPKLDQSRVELVAYPTHRSIDDLSLRLIPFFSVWKPLSGMSDKSAAEMIRADGIHILIDLSGHTAENRLSLFAWKPAPVQVSWLGYFATTGVREMDYFIADEAGAPPSMPEKFCERIWYLPDTRLCFSPPNSPLEVATLPALVNGYVTFGCFQNLKKLQDPVLQVWAEIMSGMPSAKLRIQNFSFADPVVMDAFRARFLAAGGDPDRLLLQGPVAREEYLAAHHGIDVLLDTFPFTGGATTCEALWMGVPTLTLAGGSLIARQGASLMTAAGFPDWVASTTEEYVAKALAFSADLQGLSDLRQKMRARVLGSALYDAERFSRNLEAALFSMWHARQGGDNKAE